MRLIWQVIEGEAVIFSYFFYRVSLPVTRPLFNKKNRLLRNQGLKLSRHQQDTSNYCQCIYKPHFPFTKQNVCTADRMAFFPIMLLETKSVVLV